MSGADLRSMHLATAAARERYVDRAVADTGLRYSVRHTAARQLELEG